MDDNSKLIGLGYIGLTLDFIIQKSGCERLSGIDG